MATDKAVATAAKNVSETAAAVSKSLVENGKINYKKLAEMGTEVRDQLIEVHSQVEAMWVTQKCRDLATFESIIRNTVEYLDRLPKSAQAMDGKDGGSVKGIKRASILTKPR